MHLSAEVMTNWAPSRDTSSARAAIFALANAYKSVSSLKRKDTASAGNFSVVPDQYSMTPDARAYREALSGLPQSPWSHPHMLCTLSKKLTW